MKIDTYEKKGLFKNIRSLYRFQIIDTNTYDVKWVIEMSKLNLFVIIWVLLLFFLLLAFVIFAITPLRFLLPDYVGTNADDKKEVIQLKLKTEELEEKIHQYTQYYTNLELILKDSIGIHQDYLQQQDKIAVDSSYYFPTAGKLESRYRKEFENLLQKDRKEEKSGKLYILNQMHLPVEGKPVAVESVDLQSKTLKIKAKNDASVYAVLAGVVIAKYLTGNKIHLFIQHENNILSIYKFEGRTDVSLGEKVFAGQLIGVISEKGDEILSFDLWVDTESLAPGQFFKY